MFVCDHDPLKIISYGETIIYNFNPGVAVSELSFPDGSAPTQEIIEQWLSLVNKEFNGDPDTCVGVHCVTGLGR